MEGMSYAILLFTLFKFVCSLKEQLTPTDITGITHTCPNRAFTSSFADTYGQCLQHCWMTTGCSASTWIPRSSVCRLHEDGYSLPPQTPENTSCLFTEVSTSHLSKHHPCEGRPCDAGQTCVAVEAASNFICLHVPVVVTTSTTVPPASSTTTPTPTTTMSTSANPATITTTTSSTTSTTTSATITATNTYSTTSTTTTTTSTTTTTVTTSTTTTTTPGTTTTTSSTTTSETSSQTTDSATSAKQPCSYMGCYLDDSQRMLDDVSVESEVLTLEWCMAKCREGNHKYTGLQYYRQCFCGDSYDVSRYPQKEESECNTPCRGNPQQMCGGTWRSSVYLCR